MLPRIEIFGLEITTYNLFIGLSFLLAIIITLHESKRYKIELWKSIVLCLIIIIFGYLGTKVLAYFQLWLDNPSNVVVGGGSLFGGILLLPLVIIIYQKIIGEKDNRLLDSCTIGLFSGIALSKFACFCEGCCKGITLSGGISFVGEEGIYRFPIQLVEIFFTVLIVSIVALLRKEGHGINNLYVIALVSYCFVRICLEFLRDERTVFMGLKNGQIISLITIVIIAIYYLAKKIISNKKANI